MSNVHAFNSYNVHANVCHMLNPWIRFMQDLGALTCRGCTEEFSNREPMVDDRVVNIIKALGLEGLL